ncbi:MAG: hypothetical protein IT186_24220 [Acidobacteria bacterium]|nr:hypothetical protein [Acidobacteriota bacterium]MCG3195275.1 hypothetical protein [Thermoanaerobaculia bacterium]
MSSGLERVRGEVLECQKLGPREKDALFSLMERHYDRVERGAFESDLSEKHWVVLLRAEGGDVKGFSTLAEMRHSVGQESIRALFSGDTVVDRAFRVSPELSRTWGAFAFRWAEEVPTERSFWFLISSGFRTFRFLPVFFSRYVPSPAGNEVEDWSRILFSLARERFGQSFDPETGIVRLKNPTPLKAGEGEPTGRERSDPDVEFFLRRNPGWAAGDELACLTEISRTNLTRAGARMLREPGR